jgi:hypothetical protein
VVVRGWNAPTASVEAVSSTDEKDDAGNLGELDFSDLSR